MQLQFVAALAANYSYCIKTTFFFLLCVSRLMTHVLVEMQIFPELHNRKLDFPRKFPKLARNFKTTYQNITCLWPFSIPFVKQQQVDDSCFARDADFSSVA